MATAYAKHINPFSGRSDVLTKTDVPVGSDPRKHYLKNPHSCLPPRINSSAFVPKELIEHLMRMKKDSAIGVKFNSGNNPPDAITNMEGAMHTFVTPIVLGFLHGDYIYNQGHGMTRFATLDKMQQARPVIISGQIQPDFEGTRVLAVLCALRQERSIGKPLPATFSIMDTPEKQKSNKRAEYDAMLRQHMIYHLTQAHILSSAGETDSPGKVLDITEATSLLEYIIKAPSPSFGAIRKFYLRTPNGFILSLEMLFNIAVHQLQNELSALEALCPQGYVYTSDPPSIFAREIGATILNRLQFVALRLLACGNAFSNMRVFAFNDYADPEAISLLKSALSNQPHIQVLPKSALFKGPKGTYKALPGCEGALLVIHNNSDAFGQNIETEHEGGSLDGAIGANSSAAASLQRERLDLVMYQM